MTYSSDSFTDDRNILSVRFDQTDDPERIKDAMLQECANRSIPVSIEVDNLKTGGMLKKTFYPVLTVRHPNPPQRYGAQAYVITPNMISIYTIGRSDASYEQQIYENYQNGVQSYGLEQKKMYAKFLIGKKPDNIAYNIEMEWQNSVLGVFADIFDVQIN